MTSKVIDRISDKGIDILVVIVGILIALSIDSYKDSRKTLRQWKTFTVQFKADVDEFGKTFPEMIAFYKKQTTDAKTFIQKVDSGSKKVDGLSEFVQGMGRIQVDFPMSLHYESLVRSGNEYLLNDIEKIRWFGNFYFFEKVVMIKAQLFSDHFSPDYKNLLKKYFDHDSNLSPIRKELSYVLHLYMRMMQDMLNTYEKQEEVRLKVAEILRNERP